MSLLNKHFWKFFAGMVCLIILGLVVVLATDYYTKSKVLAEQAKQEKAYQDLKKLYEEDTYGGKTPEETLALFIDALKKGDTDLASKYFLPNEQEKWKDELNKTQKNGLVESMILDLKKTKLNIKENKAFFSLIDEHNIVTAELIMEKSQSKGIWKILEL